jgi:alpha-L-rhamnosidase
VSNFFFAFAFLLVPSFMGAQPSREKINPDLLGKTWKARWIFHPTASGTGYGVFHFRKTFELDHVPENFIIHVSADNRYRLFVNGIPVSLGPARGDILNWRYETLDISPWLHKGKNTLASVVWNFGEHRPLAQFTIRSAFILQGNTEKEDLVNTGNDWKVIENKAYRPIPITGDLVQGYYCAGPGDEVTASLYPWGWELPGFDDSAWPRAGAIHNPGVPRGLYDYSGHSGWNLVPREIPLQEEKKIRFHHIERSSNDKIHDEFLQGTQAFRIPPNARVTLLLDQNELTIAYPELWVSKGKGSKVIMKYAEALTDGNGKKGNRNETKGKSLRGYQDIFMPDGNDNRLFRPLWYRTYRYVEIDIETADEELLINDLYGIFTAYPFEESARFESGDKLLRDIWNTSWRTARLCATETYMDCPYYEQLQYLGDTRIQALISLYVSGDDRLMRNALTQFDHSRIPDGLTTSRYPSFFPQVTPPFSLIWILMIHDYYMLRPDFEFTGQFLPGIKNVLGWYELKLADNGILGKLPWPNYMDAAPGFQPAGSPPTAEEGQSAQITMLYAYALDHAAELFDAHEKYEQGKKYRERSASLKSKLYDLCYDEEKKLFAETPAKKAWTQHTNILAVLADAIPQSDQREMMLRILNDGNLIPAQIYFRFYLFLAMFKTGLGDQYLENLGPWETMLKQGLTTFAEKADDPRSDCHAWSAHPCYFFLSKVCGIQPAGPGFHSVKIEPRLGRLQFAEAYMPHPEGAIEVSLQRIGTNGLRAEITLPDNVSGIFLWKNLPKKLGGGKQTIEF